LKDYLHTPPYISHLSFAAMSNVLSVEKNVPPRRLHEIHSHPADCRFPATRLTDKSEDRTFGYAEIHIVDGLYHCRSPEHAAACGEIFFYMARFQQHPSFSHRAYFQQ
jgi:hypothetical protein